MYVDAILRYRKNNPDSRSGGGHGGVMCLRPTKMKGEGVWLGVVWGRWGGVVLGQ